MSTQRMKVEALRINISNKYWTCDGQSDLSRTVLAAEVWSQSSDESRTYSVLICVCQQRWAQPPRGLQWVVGGATSLLPCQRWWLQDKIGKTGEKKQRCTTLAIKAQSLYQICRNVPLPVTDTAEWDSSAVSLRSAFNHYLEHFSTRGGETQRLTLAVTEQPKVSFLK